jgi:hypothetical protein
MAIQTFIEKHFPRVREVYVSPLSKGDDVITSWQVEVSFGNGKTASYRGMSVATAMAQADNELSK